MGSINKNVTRVKLFSGFIFSDAALLEKAVALLEKKFGKIDLRSPLMDFDKTEYYTEEMGPDLKRCFVSFHKLIKPESIVAIKILTNSIEERLSDSGTKRKINLDPGYLTAANVALATTKDFQHRVYLRKGIYLENTLRFRSKQYMDWEWTFPDYRTEAYKAWFMELRKIYRAQLDSAQKAKK